MEEMNATRNRKGFQPQNKTQPQPLIIPRNDLAIYRTYQVEVPLNNTTAGAKNKFVLNEVLNPKATGSVVFTGMETFYDAFCAKSESGRPVVDIADSKKIAIVLAYGANEFMYLMPYLAMNSAFNFGMIRRLKNIKVSLTNSYIQIMDDTAAISNTKSAIVNFYYRNPDEK